MLVDVQKLDLTTELFGNTVRSILAGPMAGQTQFHPEGELATARGAAAAKTMMVVSSPFEPAARKIAAQAKSSFWYQIYPSLIWRPSASAYSRRFQVGCKACVSRWASAAAAWDENRLEHDRPIAEECHDTISLKGIMSPDEALARSGRNQGMVVSSHGDLHSTGLVAPIDMLAVDCRCCGRKGDAID